MSTTTGSSVASVPKPSWRGVLHTWAFASLVPAGIALFLLTETSVQRVSIVIYLAGIGAMFGVSALYHRVTWRPTLRATFQRLDHCTIFLAIAGTYTPIALIALRGWPRETLLLIVWIGTAVGISLQWLPVHPPRWLFTAVYAVVGWAAVTALPQLWHGLGVVAFCFVVAGGVMYTVGAVIYALRRPNPWPTTFGFHEVFHACTLVAASFHFTAIVLALVART